MSRKKSGSDPPEDDDRRLWSAYSQRLKPLKSKSRVPVVEASGQRFQPAGPVQRPEARDDLRHAGQPAPGKPPRSAAAPLPGKSPAAGQGLDHRHVRRIVRGRVEIEARIDLHGMRQEDAHAALRGFLARCAARGQRNVLIITGKGGAGGGRGVLKRNVPRWLREPDIAPLVVGFTGAHARHGGEGALYVRVRVPGQTR